MLTVIVIPSEAVLKEKDLTQTLSILRNELEKAHNDLGKDQKRLTEAATTYANRLSRQ